MKKTTLQAKVIDFIQRQSLVLAGETVVVGVSGGADSVCLLHVLAKWQKELGIELHVAHLNHQLRGAESEADAEYVSDLSRSLGIPVTIDRQDVAAYRRARNLSVEEAARELRHAFLAGVAAEVGASRIALGHTRDDQVETILMHILRGTGTSGLCGLAPASPLSLRIPTSFSVIASPDLSGRGSLRPTTEIVEPVSSVSEESRPEIASSPRSTGAPRNDEGEVSSLGTPQRRTGGLGAQPAVLQVIRPLLNITREETTSYCQEYQLDPRIDASNLSLSFLRNRLRLQLLPLLRQYNPGVDQALLRLADIAREDSAFIEQQAARLWDKVARQEENAIRLDRKQTARLPVALQRQLLRAAVARLVGDTRDIEASHIEAARGLLSKPVGKRLSLPHGLICHGEYDELVIVKQSALTNQRFGGEAPNAAAVAGQSQISPCPLPPLSGKFPLEVPGETVLPGWKVRASIVPDTSPLSLPGAPPPCHCEESLPLVIARSPDAIGTTKQSRGEEIATSRRVGTLAADFDLQKTGRELFVRQRRPGDRFQPLGMDTPKKLQDFMVDARIPRSWRDHIPIVCSSQQIVWVVGWRIDDRVKVTAASKEILRLEFVKSQRK